MTGDWLALGAVGALATVGALRRGSRAEEIELVDVGYYCFKRPLTPESFDGSIGQLVDKEGYLRRDLIGLLSALPEHVRSVVEGHIPRDHMREIHLGIRERASALEESFERHHVKAIKVFTLPLSWEENSVCYRVSIDSRALLGATWVGRGRGGGAAWTVLYYDVVAPVFDQVAGDPTQLDHDALWDGEIDPFGPWGKYALAPTLRGRLVLRKRRE